MGYPFFPDVPKVLGVPSIPRFPTSAPQIASLVGSITGSTLSVSSITSGILYGGSSLAGSGLATGTRILNQLTGPAGGIGSYLVNQAQSFAGSLTSTFLPPNIAGVDFLGDDTFQGPPGQQEQWGIFKDGEIQVHADNCASVEYSQEFAISNYQVQQGQFASYDKVYIPFEVRVVLSKGGALADRQDFLDEIDAIIGTTDLYDVVTPEKTYTSVNLERQGYVRQAQNGAGLIKVELKLIQVNEGGAATFSAPDSTPVDPITDPKNPVSTSLQSLGTVQPHVPNAAQLSGAFLNDVTNNTLVPLFQ